VIIVATSIQLKHWGWVGPFAVLSLLIRGLMMFKPGLKLVQMKRDAQGRYLTLTAWQTAPDMLNFRNHGIHAFAMNITPWLLKEAQTARWQSDALPSWAEAEQRLSQVPPYRPQSSEN